MAVSSTKSPFAMAAFRHKARVWSIESIPLASALIRIALETLEEPNGLTTSVKNTAKVLFPSEPG